MSKLITPSLINSIDWLKCCPYTWKESAREQLKNLLARKWTEPNKVVRRGIDFENAVYRIIKSGKEIKSLKSSDLFKNVIRICMGWKPVKGETGKTIYIPNTWTYGKEIKIQQVNKSIITIKGIKYCLYGKEDITHPETILDIKTTSS